MKSLENLIKILGYNGVMVEVNLYNIAAHYCESYTGGYWKSKTLLDRESNEIDAFYLELDDGKKYTIRNCANFDHKQKIVEMDSKTFSYTMFAFLCSHMGNYFYSKGDKDTAKILFDLYYFMSDHAEEVLSKEGVKHFFLFLD